MRIILSLLAAALALSASAHAAGVKVEHPWMRATLPGQKVTAGFLDLTADSDMKLVAAASPVARRVELHLMRMADGRMEMRELQAIPLAKGKTVNLAPGGMHLMLIDLKAPIKAGETVPLALTFRAGKGRESTLETTLMVRAREE